jgi:vitamin-K-epoxide reductase (warfarin-sensitive)
MATIRHMRYVFILLAICGIVVSSLALREHYREDQSPCSINDKWDCGIVNKSQFAVIGKIPVAVIGIAGYLLLGVLGAIRRYRMLLAAAIVGLCFSLYLTYIEARVLEVWCIYCVISLGIISAIAVSAMTAVTAELVRASQCKPNV